MKIAVTGVFSHAGKYITRRLLARDEEVITLTGHPNRPDKLCSTFLNRSIKGIPNDY